MAKKSKIKKVIFSTTLSVLPILSTAFLLTSCFSTKQNNLLNNNISRLNNGFVYQGQYFENIEELAAYFIETNKNAVSSEIYMGDINSAIVDHSTGMININALRPYNPSKLYPVYLNSLNQPTPNYEEAKKSYVNKGLIKYKYFDFNGAIFNTYDEAQESILNSKNAIPIQYYNDIDLGINNIDKFNPLSKDDLVEFKKNIYNELVNVLKNYNDNNLDKPNSKLSIKLYDESYLDSKGDWQLSSKYSSLLLDKNLIDKIIKDCVKRFFDIRFDQVKKSKYTVTLDLVNVGKSNYVISNFTTKNNSATLSNNSRTIIFNNVSFEELLKFNIFINRDDLVNSKNGLTKIEKQTWAANDVAEECNVNNLNNTSFKINYVGDDKGAASGIDIKILTPGTESNATSYLSFNVKISLNNFVEFKDEIATKYNKEKQEYILNNLGEKSLLHTLYSLISEQILTNLSSCLIHFNKDYKYDYFKTNQSANMNEISNFKINDINKNELISKGFDFKYGCLRILKSENSFNIDESQSKNIVYTKSVINFNDIVNTINKNNVKYCFVIDYNNCPLFKINNLHLFDFFENISKANIVDIDYLFNNNTVEVMKNQIFNETIFDLKNVDKNKKDFINSFENLSQSFQHINECNEKLNYNYLNVLNDKLLFTFGSGHESLIINEQNDVNDVFEPGNENIVPNLTNALTSYPIESIVNSYQKIVDFLKKDNASNYQNILEKQVNKPDDIVVLYNTNEMNQIVPLSTIYREFLSNGTSISPSIINNTSLKLYDSNKSLQEAIKTTLSIKPAKVVVIYDLLGNVINPGIKLTEDEQLSTTSDAIFDSEQNIIDNILRTKLIPQDTNKRYYLDDNGQYYLLENKVVQVYKLSINNKVYYYKTHDDLMNALCEYLIMNSERVN